MVPPILIQVSWSFSPSNEIYFVYIHVLQHVYLFSQAMRLPLLMMYKATSCSARVMSGTNTE